MSALSTLLAEIVGLLESSGFCKDTQIAETAFFSQDQFFFKIRTTVFSSLSFQIRIYYNRGHCDYSYQVFREIPLCRWDNKEHPIQLENFPHHYHSVEGKIQSSPLQGKPESDLIMVLAELKRFFGH
ncbi:MAG: toxin-antitoxin system TumE family protein [bacterium]